MKLSQKLLAVYLGCLTFAAGCITGQVSQAAKPVEYPIDDGAGHKYRLLRPAAEVILGQPQDAELYERQGGGLYIKTLGGIFIRAD